MGNLVTDSIVKQVPWTLEHFDHFRAKEADWAVATVDLGADSSAEYVRTFISLPSGNIYIIDSEVWITAKEVKVTSSMRRITVEGEVVNFEPQWQGYERSDYSTVSYLGTSGITWYIEYNRHLIY